MTSKRDKITAALLTAFVALVVLLILLFTGLSSVAAQHPEPTHSDEVFYEVMDLPEEEVIITEEVAPAEESSGLDVADEGKSDAKPDPVVSTVPQPDNTQVQKPEKPDAPGADKEEQKPPRRRPGAKPPTAGSFSGTDAGKENSTGNSPYAIPGRGVVKKPTTVIRTKSAQSGWVDVEITVSPQGKVIKAEVTNSSGFGDEEDEIRQKAMSVLKNELQYSADNSIKTNITYIKRVPVSPK